MPRKGVEVYYYPNREIRSFLMAVDIFPPRVEHFRRPLGNDREHMLRDTGVLQRQAMIGLLKIPGIRQITIKPREVRITKEASGSWETIERQVIEVLERALRKKDIRVLEK